MTFIMIILLSLVFFNIYIKRKKKLLKLIAFKIIQLQKLKGKNIGISAGLFFFSPIASTNIPLP